LAYWLYIGGDIYYERFLLLFFPMGISLLIRLIKTWEITAARMTILISAMVILQLTPLAADSRFRYSTSRYDSLIEAGKFIKMKYPGKVMATSAAGKPAYYSGLQTIDMYGLNDLYIGHKQIETYNLPGHNKFDMDYVLSRKPDIIFTSLLPNFEIFQGYRLASGDSAGYEARYLVNAGKYHKYPDIIDIKGVSLDSLKYLIENQYEFIVLERRETSLGPIE
jgi:hypothetical protein